jgi:hypothetical protein
MNCQNCEEQSVKGASMCWNCNTAYSAKSAAGSRPVDEIVVTQVVSSVIGLQHHDAIELAKRSDYAQGACETDDNPINWADAGAFFLEGYWHAINLLERKLKAETS